MDFSTLTPLEIQDLINKYQSELRKLDFQVQQTSLILHQLEQAVSRAEAALSEIPAAPAPAAKAGRPRRGRPAKKKTEAKPRATGRRGRPPKAEAAKKEAKEVTEAKETPKAEAPKAPKAKRGPKPKKEKAAAAKKEAKPKPEKKADSAKGYRLSAIDQFVADSLKSQQKALITADFVELAKENPAIKGGEAQIKVKLNRSLHKLANKKDLLVKVEYPGRGYAYALQEWVNRKGELPKKYAR